jgi:hypothetical protein
MTNVIEPVQFKPATRDDGTNLLTAIAGASGTGKTFSALRLARGLVGPNGKIALVDTEGGRAKHYADAFRFDHGDMAPPFTPERFRDVALQVEGAGYDALIFDSMSDEYEGEGGLQDMHDEALLRMARKSSMADLESWQFDKLNAPAWREPKVAHKRRLIARLRVMRMHLIFCLRAEEKIRFVKVTDDQGREKTRIEPAGWTPICEKRFPYDMTLSMLFAPDNPGVPMMRDGKAVHGKIPEQLLFAFQAGQRVSEETGARLAEWAHGKSPEATARPTDDDPKLRVGKDAARQGMEALQEWFTKSLTRRERHQYKQILETELKPLAQEADGVEDVEFGEKAA